MSNETGNEPFRGYKCSAFGPAANARLKAAELKGCHTTTGTIRKRLTNSDIIFFAGHHYAGPDYNRPLEFDYINLNDYKLFATRVKLILISSCSGLRRNALNRFRRKFPNAHIFGWISSAPLNQKGIMTKFIQSMDTQLDLSRSEDVAMLIQKWRIFIESQVNDRLSVQPYGMGYATPEGKVFFYTKLKGRLWEWRTLGN
jgi:hypothetical protein